MIGDELTGGDLDRAVAEAIGLLRVPEALSIPYSTEWQYGGPLIERFGISLAPSNAPSLSSGGPREVWGVSGRWTASTYSPRRGDGHRPFAWGDTALQAAMRCIVDLHSAGAPR